MVYVIKVCWQLASRIRMEYPDPARKLSANLYDINYCCVYSEKNSWWWTEELPETCSVSFQNKLEKLVHLVGFIIRNRFNQFQDTKFEENFGMHSTQSFNNFIKKDAPKFVCRICLSYVMVTFNSKPSNLAPAVTLLPCILDVSSSDLNLDSDQICQPRHILARSLFHQHIHQFIILKSAMIRLNYVHCQFLGLYSDVAEVSVSLRYGATSLRN